MTESPTPGQVAYAAYMAVLDLSFPMDFAALPGTYRRAWDAAAQAVLTAFVQSTRPIDAHREAERARRASAPPATGHPDAPGAGSTDAMH